MSNELSSAFHAMADPARRVILSRLATGSATVGELSRPLAMTAPAVSHHLKVLERAGLIARRTLGQHRLISLRPEALHAATDWLEELRRFWEGSFERLDAELAERLENEQGDDHE
jgi:DNA-binding transcriptional ArsR family regulator